MANEGGEGGGGFGWGLVLGGVVGALIGAFLASGPGREQVESLRSRTIELTGLGEELSRGARDAAARAQEAVRDRQRPLGRAIQDGVFAARRRRGELEVELDPAPAPPPAGEGA